MSTDPQRARLATLRRYLALDPAIPESLSRICELAAHISGLPCASVQLLDHEHQHRVAGLGVRLGSTPASGSWCRYVVDSGARFTTDDATADPVLAADPQHCNDREVRAYSSHPLRDHEGHVLGTLSVFGPDPVHLDEVTLRMLDHLACETMAAFEHARTTRDLAHSATHDPLTGLPNRVLVNDRLEHSLLRRERGRLAVALLDVNGFKRINDTLGHAVGDTVLRQVAGRLVRHTRTGDTVARLGGDEFLVIAEDLEPGGEQLVLDRLHSAFAEPLELDTGPLDVRSSIGLALAERGDTVDTLLRRADDAMYADKRGDAAR
jgi:diguanylate cyclase (GGDEF)-like protein